MPPTVTLEQAKGFSLFMLSGFFSGRGDAVVEPKPTGVDDGQTGGNASGLADCSR